MVEDLNSAASAEVQDQIDRFVMLLRRWKNQPDLFLRQALGSEPDPWQADVIDAVKIYDNVAIRACHGVGKTAILAQIALWYTICHSYARVPITAPTFNKQVKDILFAEMHKWWRVAKEKSPWLDSQFDMLTTRFHSKSHPQEWFAVGIPSSEPLRAEGYHSQHLLAIVDEAKAVKKAFFDSLEGMRTTQEAKLIVASTPGGPLGYFYDVFVKYRSTWKSLFIIHPRALQAQLKRKEAVRNDKVHNPRGGTYYSDRVRAEWVADRKTEWGEESPVYVARVIGDFPAISGDTLIPYGWIVDAENREQGAPGLSAVGCDVARYGRDRTVLIGGVGGTPTFGETIARDPLETTDAALAKDIGPDPSRPKYRSVVATADRCQLARRKLDADCIVIDDTGLNGVTDILKERGEKVVPISFGARPTDVPRDAEERARRQRRHLLDSKYVNIKAEMCWAVRTAFETGAIALAGLPQQVLDPLCQQIAMMKYEMDSNGRLRVIDPDEQDEYAAAAGLAEGKKSPDHFHALILYVYIALGFGKGVVPFARAVLPKGIHSLGHGKGTTNVVRRPGGQASWVLGGFGR